MAVKTRLVIWSDSGVVGGVGGARTQYGSELTSNFPLIVKAKFIIL